MSSAALVYCPDTGIALHGTSGASAHLRGVVQGLADTGWSPQVAVCKRISADQPQGTGPGVPVTWVPAQRARWLGPWREHALSWSSRALLRAAVRAHPPDLLWERYSLVADGGMRLGVTPRVVELNAPLTLERSRYGRIRDMRRACRLERRILQSADRVIAVSPWLAEWAVRQVGCHPSRVRWVLNGSCIRPSNNRQATRERLGLTGLVLGFLGSLKPWHGLALLRAIAEALPQATLVVAGVGPGQVPEHPRIRALGYVSPADCPHLLAACDVGLAPYAPDAPPWFCPLKIIDYLAAGLPVVASAVGVCAQLVGDRGEVVQGQGANLWAKAITRQAGAGRLSRPRPWSAVITEALAGL